MMPIPWLSVDVPYQHSSDIPRNGQALPLLTEIGLWSPNFIGINLNINSKKLTHKLHNNTIASLVLVAYQLVRELLW